VGIGNAAVAAGEDDGDGGRDEGVGATHDGGEARAEEALDQRVDPGHEQQRLHHPRLLLLREREKRWKAASFRVRLRAPGTGGGRAHTHSYRERLERVGEERTLPPPIWGTSAVGMMTVVPSMTR
jgi:hypothetical protein